MGHALDAKVVEIDRNLEAFLSVLPEIIDQHAGQYALMHNGQIIEYFSSALDAQIAGNQRYESARFSIQRVDGDPAELGFYSYAIHKRAS